MNFSVNLKNLLEYFGKSQTEVAADLGIPISTFGGYVRGVSEPDFAVLIQIADYFGITTDELLGHETVRGSNGREEDALRLFRQMTPDQQDIHLLQGKALLSNKKNRKK